VLYFASGLHSGGSEKQMLNLALRLPRDRFTPEFVLLSDRGEHADAAERADIRLHLLGARRPAHGRLALAGAIWAAAARYTSIARRGRYDIIDAWLYHGYALAALAQPLTRNPILITGRRNESSYFKKEFGRVDRALDALARRRSDAIVANSPIIREDAVRVEGADPRKIVVIRNGVLIPPPPSPADRAAIRAAWGVDEDEVVVGCVANYKPGKGLDMLVRAFGALARSERRVRLVLVGEGVLRAELARLADELGVSSLVRLHGSEPEPGTVHPGFDVFAHPSETEGVPNAVLEAAAAGLPIVATAAGGTGDVIEDGRTGQLTPVGDADAMTTAMARLVADTRLREAFGRAARDRAATLYGMDRFVAETVALYDRLAIRKGLRRDERPAPSAS
jgi:glycosyltransferase involved in cell wall biosynthesis